MTNKSILNQVPENTSLLQTNRFTFVFPTLPFLKYFVQSVGLPKVSTESVLIPTPLSSTYRHGDSLSYDQLTVTAIVDEDMRVWEETYKWIVALTKPHEFSEYIRRSSRGQERPYHDGFLTVNTNSNIPNIRFQFIECHPVSMSSLQMTSADSADTVMTIDVVFRYDTFQLTRHGEY